MVEFHATEDKVTLSGTAYATLAADAAKLRVIAALLDASAPQIEAIAELVETSNARAATVQ
jgi:hypothetical protein